MKKSECSECAPRTTDHDPKSVIPDKKRKSIIFVISCGHGVFGIHNLCYMFSVIFLTYEMVLELICDLHLNLFS